MKVLDVLEVMNDYDFVRIHGTCDLDWDETNPHILDATKVRDLGWLAVRTVSARNVVELASDTVEKDGDGVSCITIVYQ